MLKYILVPWDGSEVTEVVLPFVTSLGKEPRAQATLARANGRWRD